MKMMPPDVISHENQLQHLSQPSIFILDVFRTADHAGQIFIPHRPAGSRWLTRLTPTGQPQASSNYHHQQIKMPVGSHKYLDHQIMYQTVSADLWLLCTWMHTYVVSD